MVLLSLCLRFLVYCFFFFFNDTATTEIYTLSLHDALPISVPLLVGFRRDLAFHQQLGKFAALRRSEEHTSELQSQSNLVCRLLLEKKKKVTQNTTGHHCNEMQHQIHATTDCEARCGALSKR